MDPEQVDQDRQETETRELLIFKRVRISSLDGRGNESRITEIVEDELRNGDGDSITARRQKQRHCIGVTPGRW